MYPTNTTIELAKISQYLIDNAIAVNKQPDKLLAIKLYVERKSLEWAYNQLNIIISDNTPYLLTSGSGRLLTSGSGKFLL